MSNECHFSKEAVHVAENRAVGPVYTVCPHNRDPTRVHEKAFVSRTTAGQTTCKIGEISDATLLQMGWFFVGVIKHSQFVALGVSYIRKYRYAGSSVSFAKWRIDIGGRRIEYLVAVIVYMAQSYDDDDGNGNIFYYNNSFLSVAGSTSDEGETTVWSYVLCCKTESYYSSTSSCPQR